MRGVDCEERYRNTCCWGRSGKEEQGGEYMPQVMRGLGFNSSEGTVFLDIQ